MNMYNLVKTWETIEEYLWSGFWGLRVQIKKFKKKEKGKITLSAKFLLTLTVTSLTTFCC